MTFGQRPVYYRLSVEGMDVRTDVMDQQDANAGQ